MIAQVNCLNHCIVCSCWFVILLGKLKSTKFFILLTSPYNFLIPFPASFAKSSKTLLNLFLNFVHLETFFSQGSETFLSCCSLLRIIWIFPGRARVQTIRHTEIARQIDRHIYYAMYITKIKSFKPLFFQIRTYDVEFTKLECSQPRVFFQDFLKVRIFFCDSNRKTVG